MNPKRLLILDDHVDSLAVLTAMLNERYTLLSCSSAEEALSSFAQFKPDLLVLDIAMVPMNGMECLEAIRSTPDYRGIPAIAVTALARDVDRQSFIAAGFQAVITKPILDYTALYTTIDAALESSEYRYASGRKPKIGGLTEHIWYRAS